MMRQRSMLASVAILIGIILASAVVPSGQALAQNGVEVGNNIAVITHLAKSGQYRTERLGAKDTVTSIWEGSGLMTKSEGSLRSLSAVVAEMQAAIRQCDEAKLIRLKIEALEILQVVTATSTHPAISIVQLIRPIQIRCGQRTYAAYSGDVRSALSYFGPIIRQQRLLEAQRERERLGTPTPPSVHTTSISMRTPLSVHATIISKRTPAARRTPAAPTEDRRTGQLVPAAGEQYLFNPAFALHAGTFQVTGPQQGYLGVRVGGGDIFPLQQFKVTQSGQFFGGNLTLPQFDNGNRLTFGGTFFQTSGSATVAPTTVAGDRTLVPGVTTPGFSFNNIFNLAALGPSHFAIDTRGFAFSATYEFGNLSPIFKLATNGFTVVPLVYADFGQNYTNTGYNTTIPGYDAFLQYRSDVNDQIFRGGVGVRLQTTVPVGNVPATLFVQGQIGAAHHQVTSRESFDISIFSGAITAAELTSIYGSAIGFDWKAKVGANWLYQLPGGAPLQIGMSAFIGGDTKGGFTREYLGGPPVGGFGANEYWGATLQALLSF